MKSRLDSQLRGTLRKEETVALEIVDSWLKDLPVDLSEDFVSPSQLEDAVSEGFVDFLAANPSAKPSLEAVTAATTSNVALTGSYAIDGRAMSNGDRYLARLQTDTTQNGIYVYNSAGAHARAADMNAAGEFVGSRVSVSGGSTLSGNTYQCQSVVTTVGSDTVTIVLVEAQSTAIAAEASARAAADDLRAFGGGSATSFTVEASGNNRTVSWTGAYVRIGSQLRQVADYSGTLANAEVVTMPNPATATPNPVTKQTYSSASAGIKDGTLIPLVRNIFGVLTEVFSELALRAELKTEVPVVVDSRSKLSTVSSTANFAMTRGQFSPADGGNAFYVRGGTIYPSNGFGMVLSSVSLKALGVANDVGVDAIAPLPARLRDELYTARIVTLPVSGIYVMRGIDYGIAHEVTLGASNLQIDVAHLQTYREWQITTIGTGTGLAIIDAGPTATWLNYGTRYLVVPSGNSLRFSKRGTGSYQVTGGVFGASPPRASVSGDNIVPFVRAATIITGGQSLMDEGMNRGPAHGSLSKELAAIGGPASFWLVNVASGGSGISQLDGTGVNYWVDMTDPANPADGPLLTAAVATIAARGGDTSQPVPTSILWDQGQASVSALKTGAMTAAQYKTATTYALTRLRAMVGSDIPIVLKPIGKVSAFANETQQIRDAQYDLIAAMTAARVGIDTWDLELKDTVHPSDDGYSEMGRRDAQSLGEAAYGVTAGYGQPYFSLYGYSGTENTIELILDGHASDNITRLRDPGHLTFLNAAGTALTIVKAVWISGVPRARLKVFLDGSPLNGSFYHAYDAVLDFKTEKALRSSVTGYPMKSQKVTIPAS